MRPSQSLIALAPAAALLLSIPVSAQTEAAPAKPHATTVRADDGSVLPFSPAPSDSVAGATIIDSKMTWRKEPVRLNPGAPGEVLLTVDKGEVAKRTWYRQMK